LFWLALLIIALVVLLVFVVIWVVRTYRGKVAAGREDLVGRTAVVETALEPKGVVRIEGELWTAIIDKGRAEPEEEVLITRVEGLKLMVIKKQ
jgi:membrane protein implicated in regulation of membrane protease activity